MKYFLVLSLFLFICVPVWVYVHSHRSPGRQEEGAGFPETEVTGGGCEPPGGWVLEIESGSSTRVVGFIKC